MFDDAFQDRVRHVMERARLRGLAMSAAVGEGEPEFLCLGTDAGEQPVEPDSLSPVASITKLATALTALRLVDRGSLALDAPLAAYLPEAVSAAHDGVTLRRLLSHTSGLPLDLPANAAPYADGLDWPTLAAACLGTTLERPPATRVQYSNVGYGLLAATVERTTGQSFPDALGELVLRPLEIEGYLGTAPPRPPLQIAGVRGPHKGTPHETFNSPFWRSLAMPWAGLVTSPRGALALVRAFLGTPQGFLRPETRSEATSNQAGDLAGGFVRPLIWEKCPWGLGPELRGEKSPHWAPSEAGPDSFGHSGASGCVAWASPSRGAVWIVLGTRVADSGWLLRQGAELGRMVLETL